MSTGIDRRQPANVGGRRRSRATTVVSAVLAAWLVAASVVLMQPPPAAAADTRVNDIRSIDFGPGFDHGGAGDAAREVRHLFFGDFTADGRDDAVALIAWREDDGRKREQAIAYTIEAGEVERLGGVGWSGDWSRLNGIEIVDQRVHVESLLSGPEGSAHSISRTAFMLVDGWMRPQDEWPTKTYRYFDDSGDEEPETPTLDDGPRGFVVDVAAGEGQQDFIFSAEGGKTVLLQASEAKGELRIYERSGRMVGVATADHGVTLPDGNSWIGVVAGTSPATESRFETLIGEQRSLYAPRFATTLEVETVSSEPLRTSSIGYPQLTWAHANVDVDGVNETVRAFAQQLRADHLERARACPGDTDTRLNVDGRVELMSYDLMSVRFGVFECLCESADESRSYGLTIDLNTGDVLGFEDLVSDSELGRDLWFDAASQREWLFGDGKRLEGLRRSDIDDVEIGVVVSPTGLSLIAQGADLADDVSSAVEVYLTEEHRSVVLADGIAERAAAGADVALPVIQCGC